MENKLYVQILDFKTHGIIPAPADVPSSRGNFIATANKYAVNRNGALTRNSKVCVKQGKMEKDVFKSFHEHSGRSACWEKIKAR